MRGNRRDTRKYVEGKCQDIKRRRQNNIKQMRKEEADEKTESK